MQDAGMAKPRYSGVFDALGQIPRKHGVLALYRGIVPTLCGVAPYAGLKFASYEALKRSAVRFLGGNEQELSVQTRMVCGAVAGLCAMTVSYPFDVLRRREQTRDAKTRPYSNVFQGLAQLAREGGIKRGLYRGLSLNYMKTLPNVAIYLSLYDFFKLHLA